MADLEARERGKPVLLCQKCFALIPSGAEFCAECGAPVLDDFSEGSDSTIYPELARANLFRMRGEYKQAEDICLAILRRHPNSAAANTLLGDICAERGDLQQAAEWYEMALDITPDSAADQRKLEGVRRRIREHETAQTAKTLGLPESRPKIGIWIGGAVVFLALTATVSFLLGERTSGKKASASRDIVAPVSVPIEGTRSGGPSPEIKLDESKGEPQAPSPDLLTRIRTAAGTESARLVGASRFPETMGVVVTLTSGAGEDARRFAAEMARIVLDQVADAPSATLISLQDGKVLHVGTVTRERLNATRSDEWRAAHAEDPSAFANAVLADEWPPPASGNPPPAAEPPNEGG